MHPQQTLHNDAPHLAPGGGQRSGVVVRRRAADAAAAATDVRVIAAQAVLAGDDVMDVAERLDMPLSRVLRYAETFRAAGVAAVAGMPAADEQAVDRYLGMLAHEMRAPLTAVQAWVEMLGTDLLPADEHEQARELVFARLARLRRLCDDLLDATALRLGRLRLRCKLLDLGEVVSAAVRALGDERVVVHQQGDLELVGDPDRLDQVVTNLLANALVHGAPGPVQVRLAARGQQVEMAVRNAGPLLGPVRAERIFDAYERGCGAGHGLGLYVTREIVLAHGGCIAVDAADDLTEFVLRLPTAGPPPGLLDQQPLR